MNLSQKLMYYLIVILIPVFLIMTSIRFLLFPIYTQMNISECFIFGRYLRIYTSGQVEMEPGIARLSDEWSRN